jgi:MFS transporter, PPP family, 3-phenylpropionic acid transporter
LSFGAAHIGAMHFLTQAVPEDRAATAQGVYAALVVGLFGGLVTLASGPLYQALNGEAYGAMAVLALIGAVCAFLLMRHWQGGLVVGVDKKRRKPQPQSSAEGGDTWPEA